jgi:N-acetylated-alpha-linked acidic dipeptidase
MNNSILASWDAEEFGLMGSTEWVEDHLPELVEKTVAYINLDTAVSGPRAEITGPGEIHTIAIETMKKVIFPEGYGAGPTLYDVWYNATEGTVGSLGSGSDYAAFYHNGITSVSVACLIFDMLGLMVGSLILLEGQAQRIQSTRTTGELAS